MLNAKELKNIKFSRQMGGYKQEEVDILLDRIEAEKSKHFDKFLNGFWIGFFGILFVIFLLKFVFRVI